MWSTTAADVIAVDTNMLVFAHRADSQWHERAKHLITTLAEGTARWAIPWPCAHEFVSITTHRRIYDPPSPTALAFEQLQAWAESPALTLIGETTSHLDVLREVSIKANVGGGLVHDARIAAICVQHGVAELWSADRDFSYFPILKTRNPLVT